MLWCSINKTRKKEAWPQRIKETRPWSVCFVLRWGIQVFLKLSWTQRIVLSSDPRRDEVNAGIFYGSKGIYFLLLSQPKTSERDGELNGKTWARPACVCCFRVPLACSRSVDSRVWLAHGRLGERHFLKRRNMVVSFPFLVSWNCIAPLLHRYAVLIWSLEAPTSIVFFSPSDSSLNNGILFLPLFGILPSILL